MALRHHDHFLLGLNGALAALLICIVFWPQPVSSPEPAPLSAVAGMTTTKDPDELSGNAVSDPHPVFWQRPVPEAAPSPPPAVAPASPAPEMPRLVGLLVKRGVGMAVFEVPGEWEMRTLREGDTLAGWTLERIMGRSVRLIQNGQRVVLLLDTGATP